MLEAAQSAARGRRRRRRRGRDPRARRDRGAARAASRSCRRRKLELSRHACSSEIDLDALLSRAGPKLMLVDELAHTNVPGARHAKRWQDVEELLDAGINVYTTLNIQHLESLNDVVAQHHRACACARPCPTRCSRRPTRSSWSTCRPTSCSQRLREGKVYIREQVGRAIRNFFRKGNLTAFRELALRARGRAGRRPDGRLHARARDRGPLADPGPAAGVRQRVPGRQEARAHRQAHGRPGAHAVARGQRAHAEPRRACPTMPRTGSRRRCGWPRAWAARPRPCMPNPTSPEELAGLCPVPERQPHPARPRRAGGAGPAGCASGSPSACSILPASSRSRS